LFGMMIPNAQILFCWWNHQPGFFCMVMSWKIPTISLSDPIILLYLLLLKNPLMAHKYHGAFRMENPIKIDDNWGYPQFRKPRNSRISWDVMGVKQ
jgi:hypothetical protein